MRQSGFYWCKYLGEWKVCEWEANEEWWNIPGYNHNTIFEDQNFAKIDERRIVREKQPIKLFKTDPSHLRKHQ